MPARRTPESLMKQRDAARAEAARLRVALIEAQRTLEMARGALHGHQGDYHYTSYGTSEVIEQVLVRVEAALLVVR
jgi:hypothetical protein